MNLKCEVCAKDEGSRGWISKVIASLGQSGALTARLWIITRVFGDSKQVTSCHINA